MISRTYTSIEVSLNLGLVKKEGVPTIRTNGALLINSPTSFWYFRISLRATVPGRNRRTFTGAAAQDTEIT